MICFLHLQSCRQQPLLLFQWCLQYLQNLHCLIAYAESLSVLGLVPWNQRKKFSLFYSNYGPFQVSPVKPTFSIWNLIAS
uniref:Telomere repeat-binding factor 4-like n=1 Tax=Rhizophora mucronata TaxID=61149 RepID=A0A2P2L4G4_RHIMU